ncbi:MAG: YfhO family protein [Bacteroidales bacterium]|nr:YfhO family protein [Bacteroidales bacterium]
MNTIKKLWPTLLAILVFAVVACVYMSPVLDGKIIATSDGVQGRAAVHEAVEYYEQTGNRTWWTGSMFSGMPNYQIGGGKYLKDYWLQPVKDVLLWGHRNVIAIVLIYCLCFFALLRSMKVDKWLSIVGALAIAFSSYFFIIIGANHHSKTSTLALMSAVVAGFYLIFHGHRKTGIVLTLLCSAIGFYPHPQMSYYVCFILGAFWIAELCYAITSKAWKAFGLSTLLFAAAFGIGLGTGTAAIFANLEYAEETMRGGHSDLEKASDEMNKTKGLDLDYATAWSYGISESWTFLIPDYMGGSSNYALDKDSDLYKDMVGKGVPRKTAEQFCQSVPLYWGDQPFTAGPVYMGSIVCLLFLLGLLIVRGPYKWCLLAVTLLSIALSWGNHWMGLTRFFFEAVPMYNKFRAVSSILVIAEITMPLLGFLALKRITEAKEAALEAAGDSAEQYAASAVIKDLARNVLISAGVIVVLLLIAFATTSGFMGPNDEGMFSQLPDWLVDGIVAERAAMFKADVFRSLGFVLAAAVVIYAYVKSHKFRGTAILALILGALILLDMWPVDKRYMNDSMFSKANTFEQSYKIQPWEKQILDNDKDPNFRVFNLAANTFNDARTSYRLKSIGGYSAAKLRRYQDLIDQHLSKMHWPVLNMLNAKYIVFQDQQGGQPQVQLNPEAMGNAWFVDTLRVVQTPNEECDGLMQYDLHHTAVVDKAFSSMLPGAVNDGLAVNANDSTASVSLTKYTPEYVEYDSKSSQPGTIVFSEIYYNKGWKAIIDGQPADYYRVNYMLRALNVPAGNHHIRFEFRPESVEKGNRLSMFFVVLMYLVILGCIGLGLKEIFVKK